MSIASQLSFSTATSLLAGATGSLPYQSSISNTAFLPIGTNGYVLTSNGSVPTWTIASGVTSGTATNAVNVLTVLTATNASYYPTFVSANNAAPGAYLPHFTTSTFQINPYTGYVGIGGNGASDQLYIYRAGTGNNGLTVASSAGTNISLSANRGAGGNSPLTQAGDASIIYSAGSVDTGSLVIGQWSNSSRGMRIDSSGNVGIGVTPSYKFHVQTTSSGIGAVFRYLGGTNNPGIFLSTNESTTVSQIDASGSTSGILALATSGTERMRIDSSGNVGIGTSSPVFKLDVNGNGIVRGIFTSTGNMVINGTATGGNQLVIQGGSGASTEGAQIILGYGNNQAPNIVSQQNSTWNIDVASGAANNDLRIFRQSAAGATVVAAQFTESWGGCQFISIGVGTGSSAVTGEIRASNEITAYYTSDVRLKENIRLIENPITLIDQIRGVYFDWTDEHMNSRGGEDGYFVRKHDIGVIAQEIEAILPEIVATRDNGFKAVKYEKIVPLLIEAIKAQQKQIDQIQATLAELLNK